MIKLIEYNGFTLTKLFTFRNYRAVKKFSDRWEKEYKFNFS